MKENQRIRLSKKLLKDSLIKLLNGKSIHKISVIEICNEAQINRTTFYKYYGSQYDLLQDMENDVLTSINSYLAVNDASLDNTLQQCTKIIAFISDNIDLCRILFDNNIDPKFPEKLINLPNIKQATSQLAMANKKDTLAYTFCFIIEGGFSMIRRWMNKENREPPEDIANLFYDINMKLLPEANSYLNSAQKLSKE